MSYVIGKVKEGKSDKYAVLKVENVSEQDFINDFKDQLTNDDAKQMYEVITHYKNTGTSTGISLDELF